VKPLKNFGLFTDSEDHFIREPFIAMFKAGAFDFYAINVHSIYGDNLSERRFEAKKLAEVYAVVQSRDSENDVLLMGDFNLAPDDSGFHSLKAIPNIVFVNGKLPTSIRVLRNVYFFQQAFVVGRYYSSH
jgi:exonuclease III